MEKKDPVGTSGKFAQTVKSPKKESISASYGNTTLGIRNWEWLEMEPKGPMRFGSEEGHPKCEDIIWEYDGWCLGPVELRD